MRTTVTIDDSLYRRAKTMAAGSGRSVGEVIEDGLRLLVSTSSASTGAPAPLRRFGSGGLRAGVDLDSTGDLADLMEEGLFLDARR